jgi:hypothetical protein
MHPALQRLHGLGHMIGRWGTNQDRIGRLAQRLLQIQKSSHMEVIGYCRQAFWIWVLGDQRVAHRQQVTQVTLADGATP